MTPSEILDIEFQSSDLHEAMTVRQFFIALLAKLWKEEEGFNGKRPFGNSGWQRDVEAALIKAGAVSGKLDEDGYVDEIDSKAFTVAINQAIQAL